MSAAITPQFLSWLRSGLAAHIDDVAQDGLAPSASTMVSVAVQLQVTGANDFEQDVPSPPLRLRGPGDVVGIDPSLIVRHDPEPGTNDAENTYLTLIEFSEPDYPWRYTPAAASAEKLQPWLALVVVEERDGVWLETGSLNRLPILHVDDVARELPDLSQSWAWAHVQADHDLSEGFAAALAEAPQAFRARLLCPRRLKLQRSWLACLVPTFEAGRRAGLGESTASNRLLAWEPSTQGELLLPVYHSWRFQTGPSGDIESLIRRLQARELSPTVGRRDLNISNPGSGMPITKDSLISYQGALVSPAGEPLPWPDKDRQVFKSALQSLLNAELIQKSTPANYDARTDDPIIGPPAYAARQAQQSTVPGETDQPLWYGELNTEPQHRTVAALGMSVIRNDQEALMAKAWEFAASARQADRILTLARTAWEVARVARPGFETLSDEIFVQIAAPAMARLKHSSGLTIKGALVDSALPGGLISGTFRSLSRSVPGFVRTRTGNPFNSTVAITRLALEDAVEFVGNWATVRSPKNADVSSEALNADAKRAGRSRRARRARTAFPDLDIDRASTVNPYTGNNAPASTLAAKTRAALDPQATIKAMVDLRIVGLSPTHAQDVPDRVFVHPTFTNPMYRRLVALSVEYLVPGVGDIPNDTLGLLETNPPFVEAYLAGLNFEMGREFLWREYPAALDQTWFQTFWDGGPGAPADALPIQNWNPKDGLGSNSPPGAPQANLVLLIKSALLRRYPNLRVYAVEAEWAQESGKDVRREAEKGDLKLPLFVAQLQPDITVFGFELEEDQARGSTKASLQNPGYFFVLEQQPAAPRFGLDARNPQKAEKAPSNWKDLSWSHLVAREAPLPDFVEVDGPDWLLAAGALTSNSDDEGQPGKDSWGQDAAAMARITFQQPIRMLVHADSMLPEPAEAPKAEK